MKLTKEDIQNFATEDEKKTLKENYAPEYLKRNMELLKRDIALTKKKIINHHKQYGAHEMGVGSWADKVIGKLEDKWRMNDLIYSGHNIERKMAELLKDLWNWAINYTGVEESKQLTEKKYGSLYVSQQKILDAFIKKNAGKLGLNFNIDDFPNLYDVIEAIHDAETLWQDINRYVHDNYDKFDKEEGVHTFHWGDDIDHHIFDSILTDEEKEALLEIENYNEHNKILKESLDEQRVDNIIKYTNGDLDKWEMMMKQMSKRELHDAEFELKSSISSINWKFKKYHIRNIQNEYWGEKKERRQLYRKYLNRLQKFITKEKIKPIEYDDFGDEIKNYSDYDSTNNIGMQMLNQRHFAPQEDIDKYATPEEKEFLKEKVGKSEKDEDFLNMYKKLKKEKLKLIHSFPITKEKEKEIKNIRYEMIKLKAWLQSRGLMESKQLTETKKWMTPLHNFFNYNYERFLLYDEHYKLYKAFGYDSSWELWNENPMVTKNHKKKIIPGLIDIVKESKQLTEAKNPKGKTRSINNPYEIYKGWGPFADWEWKVLKHYQSPEKEKENPYARVFCYVTSPMTGLFGDMGDTYCKDIPGYKYEEEPEEHWETFPDPENPKKSYSVLKKDPLGFGKAIDTKRIKNMSDEEIDMISKMFK
jgi:hypothetical protein